MTDGPRESRPHAVRRARPDDLQGVLALLDADALPRAGVAEAFDHFQVIEVGGRIVAVAGLEVHGNDGVLRSVAVHPNFRGRAWGSRLTEAAIRSARSAGLSRLYLLTTTAEDFFPRFGFRRTERDAAPAAIRASVEFAEACPASAVAMVLELRIDRNANSPSDALPAS